MKHIEIDFETRSQVDLKTCGAAVYFEHPEARVLLGSYQIDHGAVRRWRLGDPMPDDLRQAVDAGATISAHNAGFEILCFEWLSRNAGWVMPRYEQFRCTAATAAAMALPRDLKTLGEVLGLDVQKDKDGYKLMRMFSIADKNGQFKEAVDHPADFEAYHRYCDLDVLTEAAADQKLVPLSADEQDVWQLSERINRRGIRIDIRSAQAAIRLADKNADSLNIEMAEVTGGAVRKVSEVSKLVAWAQEQGVDLSGAAQNDIADALALSDLPSDVRTALELRQEGAKTSVKKLEAMVNRASADGRVRGSFMYHGASTGRWTSMGVNFANMPRYRRVFEDAHLNTQTLFKALRSEDPDMLKALYGDDLGRPLHLISDAVRGFIWAAPGHDLIQADYSGIEGAVIAWLADERWKLAAMQEIIADPRNRPDMYRQTAARILNLPIETVDKKHWARQAVGKVSELACIEEGQLVLTDRGLIPIEKVPTYVRVWDGIEWVSHDGPVFRGLKEVIDYDGLRATADHEVFTDDGRQIPFGVCADEQIRLATTGLGREAVRYGCRHPSGGCLGGARRPVKRSHEIPAPSGPLHRMRDRKADSYGQPLKGKNEGLPGLLAAPENTEMAGSATNRSKGQVREPQGPRLRKLRGAWRKIYVFLCAGGGTAFDGCWPRGSKTRIGSNRELRGLCAGKHPHDPETCEPTEQTYHRPGGNSGNVDTCERCVPRVPASPPESPLFGSYAEPDAIGVDDRKGHTGEVGIAVLQTERRVWDLLNCGPRNRFTVSGKLVHNCGFQGGVSAFASMAAIYNVDLDALYGPTWENADEEMREKALKRHASVSKRGLEASNRMSRGAWLACEIIKRGWREQNSAISDSWREAEAAVREAIQNPGAVTEAIRCKFVVRLGYLWNLLPSGRCLAYASPMLKAQVWARVRLDDGEWSDAEVMEREDAERRATKGLCKIEGDTSPGIRFLGVDSTTKKWRRQAMYGGLIVQNCLSADTEVLTPYGWKTITDISDTDMLWDGDAWVTHDGLVFQGYEITTDFAGLRLTPEHKVWTNDGWKTTEDAGIGEATAASSGDKLEGLALRAFTGGRVGRVRREEDPLVGDAARAVQEHSEQPHDQHAERSDVGGGGCRGIRHQRNHASIPSGGGMADVRTVPPAGLHKQGVTEAVYDILNAGPRNRFTVRTDAGPIVVSNCTQAVARDILVNGMRKAEAAGYPVIAHVYDEMICEVPRGFGDLAAFERLICELPTWADGLPLTAGGWRGKRYRKD